MRPGRALLIVPLLIAILALPMAPARADGTQTLGCPAYGYTMQVPAAWTVTGTCSSKAKATNGHGLTMAVAVEKHGWWSDDRSRASIAGDAHALGSLKGTLDPRTVEIHGHFFLSGTVDLNGKDGKELVFAEMETFSAGRLYKFSAKVTNFADTRIVGAMGTAWMTIAIAGPAGPIPASALGATSSDAPGVRVTATHLKVDNGGDFTPPQGEEYIVTRITVANNGTSNYDANPLDFSVQDGGDGVSHAAALGDFNISNTEMQATTLAPGQKVTGDVAFEIPTSETSVSLYWEPSFLSPKVAVIAGN